MNDTVKEYTVGRCTVRISYNQHTENPLTSCDGEGAIWSRGRKHINHMAHEDMVEILRTQDYVVPLSYFEHGQCLWDVQGGANISRCPDMQWDGVSFAGIWVPDDCALDNMRCQVFHELLPGVKVEYKSKSNPDGTCITRPPKEGEKPYFTNGTCIDERFSNVITYILPDGREKGGYKNFPSAYRAAARVLGIKVNKAAMHEAMERVAIKYAAGVCKNYTSWCNGECYHYCVEDADGNHLDSCGGFVGDLEYVVAEATQSAEHHSAKIEATELETQGAEVWP